MKRLSLVLVSFVVGHATHAEDWTEYRGPTGQGLYAGKGLATEWSDTKNVAWKEAIPGKGWSSPIVFKGRVYLTSAVPPEKSKDQSLRAFCLDAESGKLVWQKEVFLQDGKKAPGIHKKNTHASPSPLTDGKRLYVHFGHQGTACLDFDGKVLWRTTELRYSPVHGNGGSPILVDDRLVFAADGGDKQFLAALDCTSGKVLWRTDRKCTAPKKFAFGTPLLITVDGKPQIVSPASHAVIAYDPDGKELWRVTHDGYSTIPRPVFGHGVVFLSTGYDSPTLMAIRPDGSGDVTKTHVAWSTPKGAPLTPSLLLVGDELYTVSDDGVVGCRDAKSGKVHWQERLEGAYSASPLYADGKIYVQSEGGVTTVLRAGKKFERLAESTLPERTFASFAAADGALFLRSEKHLYRIQEK
jgi:outer membrane protein assembly factor BamB